MDKQKDNGSMDESEDDKSQLNVPNFKQSGKGFNVLRKLSTFKTIFEDVKEDDKSSVVLSTHI